MSDEAKAGNVYVETGHLVRGGVTTEELSDQVRVDYTLDGDGCRVIVGVEILDAEAVQVEGREIAP